MDKKAHGSEKARKKEQKEKKKHERRQEKRRYKEALRREHRYGTKDRKSVV